MTNYLLSVHEKPHNPIKSFVYAVISFEKCFLESDFD